jgi:alkylhydroperoxidase family enzyme
MAKGLMAFAGSLKANRTLPARMIELVRLRIAFHNQCRSCMAIRYPDALADGLTEDLVCSLEKPMEADDLTPAEQIAIRYGELFATNHLAIDDDFYDQLREHFTEPEIVELGLNVALCVGVGRLSATWDMIEELPDRFQEPGEVTPWGADDAVVVH